MTGVAHGARVLLPVLERRNGPDRRHSSALEEESALIEARFAERHAAIQAEHEQAAREFTQAVREIDAAYRNESAQLIVRFLRAVGPQLAMTASLLEFADILEQEAEEINAVICLRVHPDTAENLKAIIGEAVLNEAQIEFKADESVRVHSIDATWQNGAFFHNPDQMIESFIERLDDAVESRFPKAKSDKEILND